MSEETAAAASTDGNTATSNHMATLVPTFDPAKDDLEQYTQKVELLSEIWPGGKLNELITRCSASSCTGGSVGRDLRTSPTGELKQALQILNAASSRRH